MELMEAVRRHHKMIEDKGYECVMTVLIGSQNYNLNTENSDVDTFTFVLPSLNDLAFVREVAAGEFEVDDGKCMYKDIRVALNLLKKTSPNSVECFLGKYRVFNPKYEAVLSRYLNNEDTMNKMIHCNYSHMLYAMAGMAHQLTKRNMIPGKRFYHATRLRAMANTFCNNLQVQSLLEIPSYLRAFVLEAKTDTSGNIDWFYEEDCFKNADALDNLRDNFVLTEEQKQIEVEGLQLVEEFQLNLTKTYLKEIV